MTATALDVALDVVEESGRPDLANRCRVWLKTVINDEATALALEWSWRTAKQAEMKKRRKALHLLCEVGDPNPCWGLQEDGTDGYYGGQSDPYLLDQSEWCEHCVESGKLTTVIRANGHLRGALLRKLNAIAKALPDDCYEMPEPEGRPTVKPMNLGTSGDGSWADTPLDEDIAF